MGLVGSFGTIFKPLLSFLRAAMPVWLADWQHAPPGALGSGASQVSLGVRVGRSFKNQGNCGGQPPPRSRVQGTKHFATPYCSVNRFMLKLVSEISSLMSDVGCLAPWFLGCSPPFPRSDASAVRVLNDSVLHLEVALVRDRLLLDGETG